MICGDYITALSYGTCFYGKRPERLETWLPQVSLKYLINNLYALMQHKYHAKAESENSTH